MSELTLEQMKANRKLWVEALRSGKYEQCNEALRIGTAFCCLGVLADIAGCEWEDELADGEMANAPARAMDFVGLRCSGGQFVDDTGDMTALWSLNDEGQTFKKIADVIESEPSNLFIKEPA